MKHPTTKRPPRSRWRRFTRWLWRWVDDLTRVDVHPQAKMPDLDERKARVWR